jgi:hypothetical protein
MSRFARDNAVNEGFITAFGCVFWETRLMTRKG